APHDVTKIEAGDLCKWRKHRSSCSTLEEDFFATVIDSSAVPEINALPSCHAISKTPRAAGYRVSDFVLWHPADGLHRSANMVGFLRDMRLLFGRNGDPHELPLLAIPFHHRVIVAFEACPNGDRPVVDR